MTDPTPAPAAAAPFTDAEDKQYSTLATFLNIILLIPGLVFYLGFGKRGPRIAEQSKENLNWTINITAIYVILYIIGFATLFFFVGGIFIFLAWLVAIANLIFSILGGVKVSNTGELYKYPVNIRWIK
jgi:uncharacterized Tic20 family protein